VTLVDHGLAARVAERALRYGGDDTRTARRGGRGAACAASRLIGRDGVSGA